MIEAQIELTFTEPKKGKLPISKNEDGKIHLLDWDFGRSHRVNPGETWLCEVLKSDVRKSIVRPMALVTTKEYNFVAMKSLMSNLKSKYHDHNS